MTWLPTETGRIVELLAPVPAVIDFRRDVAPALARIARFTGHVGSGAYPVAQHCVVGCDALMAETGRADFAAAFLLHDAHEYVFNDQTTPVRQAIGKAVEIIARMKLGKIAVEAGAASWVDEAVAEIKAGLDRAIYARAGLPVPSGDVLAAVRDMDNRMCRAERDQFFGKQSRPWHAAIENAKPVRMTGKLAVWAWPKASDQWLARLARYCPNALT